MKGAMQYIRDHYGVPVKRGGRVEYTGEPSVVRYGTVTSVTFGSVRIRLDGDKHALPFHPTWCLKYLASAEVSA